MYFIEKIGIYGHGVFWIGDKVEEGISELERLCESDYDSYHDWELKEFEDQHEMIARSRFRAGDAEHREIASGNKECGVTITGGK